MPLNDLDGLTPEEIYLSRHIRCLHGSDQPPGVEAGGAPFDFRANERNVIAQEKWAMEAQREKDELFKRQGEEFRRRFSIADNAPEAPKQN
jgi:hypothetical protein